jgi:mono/diheme cytochrome c family protein
MKRTFTVAGIALLLAGLTVSPAPSQGGQQQASTQRAFINRYCANCHNNDDKVGGLSFDGLNIDHPEANPELWEKVTRKMRAGVMPPSGAPRPDRATYDAFRRNIETAIDAAAQQKPNPGITALHRLNRT